MPISIAQLNDSNKSTRIANRLNYANDPLNLDKDVRIQDPSNGKIIEVSPSLLKSYSYINYVVLSDDTDEPCLPYPIPTIYCCTETNELLTEIRDALAAANEKPFVKNISGCYSYGGGLVEVDGYASVLPSTLAVVKLKATVIGFSDSILGIAIGDILTEAELLMENKRNCCTI